MCSIEFIYVRIENAGKVSAAQRTSYFKISPKMHIYAFNHRYSSLLIGIHLGPGGRVQEAHLQVDPQLQQTSQQDHSVPRSELPQRPPEEGSAHK